MTEKAMTTNRQRMIDVAVSCAMVNPIVVMKAYGQPVEPFAHLLTCKNCAGLVAEQVHHLWPTIVEAFDKPDVSNVVRLKR